MATAQQSDGGETSPELLRLEWKDARTRLEALQRQHAALLAFKPTGAVGAQRLRRLDEQMVETEILANELMGKLFQSAGLPRQASATTRSSPE